MLQAKAETVQTLYPSGNIIANKLNVNENITFGDIRGVVLQAKAATSLPIN